LKYLSLYSGIAPIVLYLMSYKRNRGTMLWVIFVYLLLSAGIDIIIINFRPPKYTNVRFTAYSLFTLIEYLCFSYYIYSKINTPSFKLIISIISAIFLFLMGGFVLENFAQQTFDSFTASLEAIIIIFYCLLFFFEQISSNNTTYLYNIYSFWIIIAFLFYLAGGLFLYALANNLSKQEVAYYWNINYIFNVFKNLLFAIAFFMKKNIASTISTKLIKAH
jgi:hypothetical protein